MGRAGDSHPCVELAFFLSFSLCLIFAAEASFHYPNLCSPPPHRCQNKYLLQYAHTPRTENTFNRNCRNGNPTIWASTGNCGTRMPGSAAELEPNSGIPDAQTHMPEIASASAHTSQSQFSSPSDGTVWQANLLTGKVSSRIAAAWDSAGTTRSERESKGRWKG